MASPTLISFSYDVFFYKIETDYGLKFAKNSEAIKYISASILSKPLWHEKRNVHQVHFLKFF